MSARCERCDRLQSELDRANEVAVRACAERDAERKRAEANFRAFTEARERAMPDTDDALNVRLQRAINERDAALEELAAMKSRAARLENP